MKKGIVAVIALFVMLSVVQGCAKKPMSQADQIIGTWMGTSKDAGNFTFSKDGSVKIFNEFFEIAGTFSIPNPNKLALVLKNPENGQEMPQTIDFLLEKDLFKLIPPADQTGQGQPPSLEFKRATEKDIADYEKAKEASKKAMEQNAQTDDTKTLARSENDVLLETTMGNIRIELYPEIAPKTVANLIKLVQEGFYNGIIFHRVIPDFMIQMGGTKEDGSAKEVGYQFEDEINPKALGLTEQVIQTNIQKGYKYSDTLKSIRLNYGVLAMANAGPNTNGSQVFIITKKDGTEWLNGLHTGFGKVIEGMDVALKIQSVPRNENQNDPNFNKPNTNVVIKKASLVPHKK